MYIENKKTYMYIYRIYNEKEKDICIYGDQ